MRLGFLACVPLLAGACSAAGTDAAADSYQDEDIPMGMCPGTECPQTDDGDPDSGAAVGDPCDGTNQCAAGFCAATFDEGDVGELVCQSECIELQDDAMWCSDSASCCDADAVCTPRGFCVADGVVDETGGDGTDSGTTSGGTDSGDSTSASGSGSDSDSGSGSGSGTTGGGSSGSTGA